MKRRWKQPNQQRCRRTEPKLLGSVVFQAEFATSEFQSGYTMLARRPGIPACSFLHCDYVCVMPLTSALAAQLRRLTPREKAAIADHLWREAEPKLGPTASQVAKLEARAAAALKSPQKLRPLGDAVRRLRR